MHNVIGMEVSYAVKILNEEGFDCEIHRYEFDRPLRVTDKPLSITAEPFKKTAQQVQTDTVRVVSQRMNGEKSIELIVSGFKTMV